MGTNVSNKTKWWLFVLSIPIMIWTIIPLLWTLALSGKKAANLADPTTSVLGNLWPKGVELGELRPDLKGRRPGLFLARPEELTDRLPGGTLISVILANVCAYAISKLDFRARG